MLFDGELNRLVITSGRRFLFFSHESRPGKRGAARTKEAASSKNKNSTLHQSSFRRSSLAQTPISKLGNFFRDILLRLPREQRSKGDRERGSVCRALSLVFFVSVVSRSLDSQKQPHPHSCFLDCATLVGSLLFRSTGESVPAKSRMSDALVVA